MEENALAKKPHSSCAQMVPKLEQKRCLTNLQKRQEASPYRSELSLVHQLGCTLHQFANRRIPPIEPTWRGFLSLRNPAALKRRPGHPFRPSANLKDSHRTQRFLPIS